MLRLLGALALFGLGVVVGVLLSSGLGLLLNPTPTLSSTIILDRIQALSELTAVRYNFTGVISSEVQMPGMLAALYGQRQSLMAVGHINAGIDLNQLTPADVTLDATTLTVRLPPPRLQDCFLNEQESYVVARDTGIFARGAPNLDTDARRYAVHQFRDQALEAGILDDAQAQAQQVITELTAALNPDSTLTVNIIPTAPDPASSPLPDTCQ